MCRTTVSVGLLLLVGVALLVTPRVSQAQHGGGGHGGGHFGGAHVGGYSGGAHVGGYHSSFGSGYHPGNFSGGHYSGYHSGYRYPYVHSGSHSYYGSYGYSPYYYGAYPYTWNSTPYSSSYSSSYGYVPMDSGDATYGTAPSGTTQTDYPPATVTVPSDTKADVTVNVPVNAELWIDGSKTTSTGTVREFQSPPLTSGSRYSYDLRARWNENGHEVTQTQQVEITAGAHVSVSFPLPPKTAG